MAKWKIKDSEPNAINHTQTHKPNIKNS